MTAKNIAWFNLALRGNLSQYLAVIVLAFVAGAAVLADTIAPYDPLEIDPDNILSSPSATHWLGTDEIGRDLLSRIIYGARVSLSVALAAVCGGVCFRNTYRCFRCLCRPSPRKRDYANH